MHQVYSLFHRKLPPKFEIEALFRLVMLYTDTKKKHTSFVINSYSEKTILTPCFKIKVDYKFVFKIHINCYNHKDHPVLDRHKFRCRPPFLGKTEYPFHLLNLIQIDNIVIFNKTSINKNIKTITNVIQLLYGRGPSNENESYIYIFIINLINVTVKIQQLKFATVHTYTRMKLFNVINMANKIKTSLVVIRSSRPCSAPSTMLPQP
ncbi:hypothetical protein AGLY_017827 [Aphis glycines]|uniref:Uncharacterized protein n=1 Tax=Aphis glycines TaxID=307491 RepID=A0A6G0STS0_APHGL|nr:hypothetical protein AGLY_017827 [Aphis glycines]